MKIDDVYIVKKRFKVFMSNNYIEIGTIVKIREIYDEFIIINTGIFDHPFCINTDVEVYDYVYDYIYEYLYSPQEIREKKLRSI
ncbi:hypothetical protein M0Q50_03365 [bacterium]|jgi:hypothetical protein|nr:hypothetical protein [bacterium]